MSFSVHRWTRGEAPNASQLRKTLVAEGYSVFEWSDAPGTCYEPHAHDDDQSHWIISGALQLTIAGETYTLGAGDRDLLPANTTHAAFVPGDKPVRYLIGSKK